MQAARAARGADLTGAGIDVLLERTSADFPYQAGADVRAPQARSPLDAVDPERGIERLVTLPEARGFAVSGWASVDPEAPGRRDRPPRGGAGGLELPLVEPLRGDPGVPGVLGLRPDTGTAWVGDLLPGARPWIEWSSPRRIASTAFGLPRAPPSTHARAREGERGGAAGQWRSR